MYECMHVCTYVLTSFSKLEPNILKFLPIIPSNTSSYYSSFILISKPIIVFFTSCLSFNLSLSSLSPSFSEFLSEPFLKRPHHLSLLASIKYLSPDYSHNYPIILKLCFSASNNSRIILIIVEAECQPIILQNYAGTLGSSLSFSTKIHKTLIYKHRNKNLCLALTSQKESNPFWRHRRLITVVSK